MIKAYQKVKSSILTQHTIYTHSVKKKWYSHKPQTMESLDCGANHRNNSENGNDGGNTTVASLTIMMNTKKYTNFP